MTKATQRSLILFRNWHSSSTVRSRPFAYQFTKADFAQTEPSLWFPAELSPALTHDSVQALPKKELLNLHVAHLVHFMDYTTTLEISYVNEAVHCIIAGNLQKYFEEEARCAALKLYADEGYHALFSKTIADHAAQHYSLERTNSTRLESLNYILEKSPKTFKCLTRFCIGFVSETLITPELLKLSSHTLVDPVANMLRDHIHDEGRHAIFFSECFTSLWQKISKIERDYVAHILPTIIMAFCEPDLPFLHKLFKTRPRLGGDVAAYVLANRSSRVMHICAPTLRAIERTELLANKDYFLLFKASGLVA